MTHAFEPQLQPVEIDQLRPTQMTVGFREVDSKRHAWRQHAERDGPEFLGRHMVPVVLGPKKRAYLVDHHHLVRALYDEGVKHVLTSLVADLSELEKTEFWPVMEHYRWVYPFDAKGARQPHGKLPKTVADLTDDPYRSLAGALRKDGGFAKDNAPYSEFLWANFLRTRIDARLLDKAPDEAIAAAKTLAQSKAASFLPGWCGRSD